MVIAKLSHFFEREFTGVHQAAFLLAITTVFAKALALVRDRMLASTFGAGEALDMYYASFRIPDFVYTLSLFIAASTALIPLLLERESKGREEASRFIGSVLSWFLVGIGVLGVALFFFMPYLTDMVTPGFNASQRETTVLLGRILLLQALFLGLSNIAASIIQAFRLFFIYALSPILYNVGIIIGLLFLYPVWGLSGIAFGVVIGAFLHVAVQIPSIIRLHFLPFFSLRIEPGLRRAFLLSFPRSVGLSINQLVFIAMTAFASVFGLGSIAVFQLAYNLETVPLSVIGLSYSVAAFPFLAGVFARDERKKFLEHVSLAIRHIIFWSLPFTILFIVLRAHIVRVILGAGNFGWVDTRLTAAALALFSVSLVAQALILLYVRAFYAGGKTITPVAINICAALFIVAGVFFFSWLYDASSSFSYVFADILRVSDLVHNKMLILPFMFSLGSILNLVLLAIFFSRDFGSAGGKRFWNSFAHISISSAIMGVVTFYALRLFDGMFNLETFAGVFLHGSLAGILGVAGGVLFLIFAKNREYEELKKALVRRFWKTPFVSQEPSSGSGL
ncbi:MAG: lipid II flippase MurJ [bacterium]|nr:lipid II flippase MurJ [bacterium]